MCTRHHATHTVVRAISKVLELTPTLQRAAVWQNLDPGLLFTDVLPFLRAPLHMEMPNGLGVTRRALLWGCRGIERAYDADTLEVLVCMRYCQCAALR